MRSDCERLLQRSGHHSFFDLHVSWVGRHSCYLGSHFDHLLSTCQLLVSTCNRVNMQNTCRQPPHVHSQRPTRPEFSQRGPAVPSCAFVCTGLFSDTDSSDYCTRSAIFVVDVSSKHAGRTL